MQQISSFLLLATFTISIIFLCSIQSASGQRAQFITYWNGSGCTGTPFGNTTSNTNIPIPAGSSNIYYRVNGLWKAQHCNGTSCTALPYILHGSNVTCESRPAGLGNTRINVIRYGDANQEVPVITFFDGPSFEGANFSVTPGASLNATTRPVRSYFFVGPNSWQHKSSQNAVSGTCLNATADVVQRGYGFTTSLSANIQVGWVQHQCNVTQPGTTTTPRTTTTTLRTTTNRNTTTATLRTTTRSNGFTHGLEIGPFIVALLCAIRIASRPFG